MMTELAFKDDLTGEEKKEKEAIERVYRRLKEDPGIMEDIEKIKPHPWVRVVDDCKR
jgi:hypothetical protein